MACPGKGDSAAEGRDSGVKRKSDGWKINRQELTQATCRLPGRPAVARAQFGQRMIRLAVESGRIVGLRPAERVLKMVWEWFGRETEVAHLDDDSHVAVAGWRGGSARADRAGRRLDLGWGSFQIRLGREKALSCWACEPRGCPPPGRSAQARRRSSADGSAWHGMEREDVALVYSQLAERYGAPRATLSDGAVELPATQSGMPEKQAFRRDPCCKIFKHKAANFLKAAMGRHPRFAEFKLAVGQDASAIQQTELRT